MVSEHQEHFFFFALKKEKKKSGRGALIRKHWLTVVGGSLKQA